jgi:transcriptional regulator with XRE-family HTH domain
MADKVGRPTKYKDDYAEQAYKLCLLGSTDKDMADFFDVSESTLNLWKLEQKEFSESIKRGKSFADANVADRLYQRATGYEHQDTEFASYQGEITDEKQYIKHYPPDTAAAIFWLKNRQKDKWRDKLEQDINLGNKDGEPLQISTLTDAELADQLTKAAILLAGSMQVTRLLDA